MKDALRGFRRWKLFVGDTVEIIKGQKDVGKRGKIVEVRKDKINPLVIIEGLNLVRR